MEDRFHKRSRVITFLTVFNVVNSKILAHREFYQILLKKSNILNKKEIETSETINRNINHKA